MKIILIFFIAFLTFKGYGQSQKTKPDNVSIENSQTKKDKNTIIEVYYDNKPEQEPAYFLNGKFINLCTLNTINPVVIDSIRVVKKDLEIDNKNYYGQIYIKTKEDYCPELISLNKFKSKYTNAGNIPTIFLIDGVIINENNNECLVDENFILKVIIERVDNKQESLKLSIIKLLTKSKENIQKSKEIRIRGTEETPGYPSIK